MEVELNNGTKMPTVIFGTFDIKKHESRQAIVDAIETGYTHIDCAAIYQNEIEVGEGIQAALESGLITREKLYVTTKCWMCYFRNVRQACLNSLKRLKLTYLDQYLLHWPFALAPVEDEIPSLVPGKSNFDRYPLHLAWAQMEALVDEGLVRSIGVSNWPIALLNDMMGFARIPPVTNQFELHPYNQRTELVNFCHELKVYPIAYRVIYRPPDKPIHNFKKCILDDPLITELASKYGKTPAQILLSWCLSRNVGYVVKTVTKSRMLENFEPQYLKLDQSDLDRINSMPFEGEYNETWPVFGIHLFK
jgi:diketogulonate reductase-like aldo/keto reductase